ncbi:63 kDa sperm flagellar membrane protein-like [Patiria miniata]|uniref:Uncharacterized protein n=1 Tax=Patiria miniata TaxID=46514 RepID=A0A913YXU8_PATMI|nr:63 kDa sperm flagellar membrane protein-like [Patiria miniata]
MLPCDVLSVFLLAALTPFASASTGAPQTNAPVVVVEEEVIIGVGNVDVRCYTCDNVYDNDECNGVHLGGNGTLTQCTQERSNCFSILKMNSAGDGYTTQKGCMDWDECYDRFYEMMADPIVGGECMRITVMDHDNVAPDAECFFCCFSVEGGSQDACNHAMGVQYLALPETNNWDPSVDKWEGHEPVENTVAPDVTEGAEAVARPLATVIGLNVLLLYVLLA